MTTSRRTSWNSVAHTELQSSCTAEGGGRKRLPQGQWGNGAEEGGWKQPQEKVAIGSAHTKCAPLLPKSKLVQVPSAVSGNVSETLQLGLRI